MISKEEVLNLAQLARLKLTEPEVERLQGDLSSILEYVRQIACQDDILPQDGKMSSLLRNVMREDAPRAEGDPMAGKEEGLREAFPRREGDYLVVRKILDKDAS